METLDRIGLAIIGCGTIGRIRAKLARQYPGVDWLGLCDVSQEPGQALANDVDADFFTTDAAEIVARPEVNAVMVLTDENNHTQPALLAVEAGHKKMFIEKPLATDPRESAQILDAITKNDVDARIAYTQRFRRRFLTIKERLTNGQIGDVHSVITRAFMNRMVPIATIEKTTQRKNLTPMVVSGTH
ncbi:MAG: Gfo/Idh/MocA family oxidoreductase, partial [Gammaproteobacteria bacterium]|nr:Gfo/Idh/MocA family oxidoreductase [Gammaproteobacteria bacterium]